MIDLRKWLAEAEFSDLDRHFARFIEAQAGGESPLLALGAALASRARGEGNICLDLASLAGTALTDKSSDGREQVVLPELQPWLEALKASPVVGASGEFKPLVLDGSHRLYLHRYWEYEQSLAAEILKRAGQSGSSKTVAAVPLSQRDATLSPGGGEGRVSMPAQPRLAALFPPEAGGEVNRQAVAALAALRGKFCAISGGPGTGKTHTLVLILALLLELEPKRNLRMAVAAPTGKAAMRIQESIRNIAATLHCGDDIKQRLPENATTIHRLLGYLPDSASFRYHADNRLPYDVVAVDEASMVDLALMAKLFQAVPPDAKMILLGDKDQLASVEAGAVLGDICAVAEIAKEGAPSALGDCVVQLDRNFRFGNDSAIYRVSQAINAGDADAVFAVLAEAGRAANGELLALALPGRAGLKAALKAKVIAGFDDFLKAREPREALAAMAKFRVLCALREGPFGVAGLNAMIEEILADAGPPHPSLSPSGGEGPWYAHRPIMVTRNDYQLKLFNGDMGVVLPDPVSGQLRAFFAGPGDSVRPILPVRLPEHETAFAMTVHKSQGSEFDRVLLLLPDRLSPVLTRELLYTGVTRARQGVELWFEEKTLRAALGQRVRRTSGLREALAGDA